MLGKIGFRTSLFLGAVASLSALVLLNPLSVKATGENQFDNTGIVFDLETIVEFEFIESNGAYQATFGVMNLQTGEKTPLLVEVKPADRVQSVEAESTYEDNSGESVSNDFKGTPGNAVPQPLVAFKFQANTPYLFYLESTLNGRPAGILYSMNSRNPGGNKQLRFEGDFSTLGTGGVALSWDDTGSLLVDPALEDQDFDDFIIQVGGNLDCPFDNEETSQ
ncbi:DUF4114 domain-containing protein [Laspinema olomoucense]|uniref:DUF4114 domain-containing protein n=1 Tax=Laspinema olomoucense TaxID=3231600 RepID=UPI0021BB1686|nr:MULTISPECIES: DUF4114 domain-containing protein [unclassified Laspinema]MCT7972022.1 DUF4114 domain-containing protein [Laspinema sp. D3d]MCT7994521.1 DUF4114 domain-containing protein [Laspinema sp. D3c]